MEFRWSEPQRRQADWALEVPCAVARFHRDGERVVAILEDGRTIDLSAMSADAKPNA